jgi:hypothetical protein
MTEDSRGVRRTVLTLNKCPRCGRISGMLARPDEGSAVRHELCEDCGRLPASEPSPEGGNPGATA